MIATSDRQYYIDWLRLIAVFLLFFYHTACVFHPWDNFYIKNDQLSPLITYIFIWAVGHWHMSLFFLLAGASTYFALQKRSGVEYVKERFKRLFIPLIFGTLVLIPPQSYLGLVNHSDYSQSFISWLPNFFHLQTADMDAFFLGGFTVGHLWFIMHLFIYSLISLPIFLYFKRESGRRWIKRIVSLLIQPPVLFLLFPALLIPISKFPWIAGGNPLFYITFFVIGFILMSDHRFIDRIDRYRLVLLLLGVVPLIGFITMDGADFWPSNMPVWVESITSEYRNAFVPWFFILSLIAYGRRFLNFSNRFLRYFAEGAYPIYILHNTVIIIIAFFVVQWSFGVGVKYAIILASSFIVTVLAYDILVRRTNITRFLFGMKPQSKKKV
ncbi:MAG TPA: acyltransferase family protein [Dehalococcoidia bacterium]|nr:acyltransferase family protein [Dehalococcoidia bacterium]